MFAAKYAVRGIPLTPPELHSVDAIPELYARKTGRRGVNYVAVDYDARDKMVYFSDIRNHAIMKAEIGSNSSLLGSYMYSIYGKMVYFSDIRMEEVQIKGLLLKSC